ncbi:MAG: hypothetical protein A3E87_06565 [Gammaproteobacteria bacterium RIFCSPHIGHO2_12_FULL_35_23]|nr:MAG: hypothetical protein A3E87_06565 [Gammaproteobacteria bacterium RIFCSPHIGHO2_12_FULL_35_23]
MSYKTTINIFLLSNVALVDFFSLGVVLTCFAPLFLSSHGVFENSLVTADRLYWLGIALAMAPLGQLISTSVLGALSDLYGRKKLLLITLLGSVCSLLIVIYGIDEQALLFVLLGRFLTGLFSGNVSIAQASLADMTKIAALKAWRFNFLQIGIGLGMLLGPLLGSKLIDQSSPAGFTLPFYLALALMIIELFLIVFCYQETLPTATEDKVNKLAGINWLFGIKQIGAAFKAKGIRDLLIAWFIFMLGWEFYVQFFTNFLQEGKLAFSANEIGNLFAYLGLVYLCCQVIIVQPSTRLFLARKVMVPASVAVAMFIFLMGFATTKDYIYVMITVYIISMAIFIPNFNAVLSENAQACYQGTVFGMSVSLHALSTVIITSLGGVLIAYNVQLPLLGGGLLIGLASIILAMTRMK